MFFAALAPIWKLCHLICAALPASCKGITRSQGKISSAAGLKHCGIHGPGARSGQFVILSGAAAGFRLRANP